MAGVSDNVSNNVVDEVIDERKIQIFKHRFELPGGGKKIDYILINFNDEVMNCQKINITSMYRIKKAYYRVTHKLKNIISDKNLIEWKQIPKQATSEIASEIMSIFDKDMYTYCLIDDAIIFAEFKPKDHKDWAIYDEYSKHALICDANEICVSGEFIKKNDNFVFDNNSGTYAPTAQDLAKLKKVKDYLGMIDPIDPNSGNIQERGSPEGDLYSVYPGSGGKSKKKRSKSKRRKASRKRTIRRGRRRNK